MGEAVVMDVAIAFEGQRLTELELFTHDELRDVIMTSPSECYDLDPLATYLRKQVLEDVLPLITVIRNRSLAESPVLLCFKQASVRLLLKKTYLDRGVEKLMISV